MMRVPLRGVKAAGRSALVDDDDYELVSGGYTWHLAARRAGGSTVDYAIAYRPGSGHRGKMILMHVLITGRIGTDHVNGDGLDNRRENLRPATRAQNAANSRKAAGCSSAFKGVCLTRWGWQAYIKVDGKRRHLGYFTGEIEAAKTYDAAAREAWGDYSRPNFPDAR
jgi:HNH endonuclease